MIYILETGYDELLNKYYEILLNELDDEGRKVLKTSQRSWIIFKYGEYDLVHSIGKKPYENTEDKTDWDVIFSQTKLELTRQRVFEIYNLLLLSDLIKK